MIKRNLAPDNWKTLQLKTQSINNVKVKHQSLATNKTKFFKDWLKTRIQDFFTVTALHGYRHIVQTDYAIWERIMWTIVCIIALISAIVLLWFTWIWNAETPTVTVIESTHFATWNIPFPAITLCNANKISKALALAKAEAMTRPNNMSAGTLSQMFRMVLHFDGTGDGTEEEYLQLHNIFKENNIKIEKFMREVAPKCEEMLERCMWKGTQTRCDSLFQMIQTAEGYCCSFNYYGLNTNNYAPKLAHNIPKSPRRVTSCGYETGLSVLIRPKIIDYHSTILSTYGFRVLIHNSYDYADDNAETKLAAANLEAFLSIAPESTYSTDDVFKLPIAERNCLSPEERKLDVMQKYSYVNCLAECRSNIVMEKCGCIPYNLPGNGTFPFCQMDQLRCVKGNWEWFQVALPGINKTISTVNDVVKSPCNCYPDCQLLQYPSEISSGVLSRKYSFNSLGFFKDITLTDQTMLHVYFKDLVSTHYRNDMYQNWLGILASFGGLLGLFLGFSLVTGFELIYFFTIRVLFDKLAPKQKQISPHITIN